jgi:predicted  nucleic acid-binding Zn-ribbon protein
VQDVLIISAFDSSSSSIHALSPPLHLNMPLNTPTRRQLRDSTNAKTRKSLARRDLTPKPIKHNLQSSALNSTNCNLLSLGDDNNRDIVTAVTSTQVDAATSLQGQEDAAKYKGGEDVGLVDSSGSFEAITDVVETTGVSTQCNGNDFVLVEVKKEEYKGDDTATNNIHQEPASSSDSGGGDISSTAASFDVTDKSTVSDCGNDTSSPPITSSPSVQGEADDDNNLALTLFTNEDAKVVDDNNPSYLLPGATITADRVAYLEHQNSSQHEIIVLLQEELSKANFMHELVKKRLKRRSDLIEHECEELEYKLFISKANTIRIEKELSKRHQENCALKAELVAIGEEKDDLARNVYKLQDKVASLENNVFALKLESWIDLYTQNSNGEALLEKLSAAKESEKKLKGQVHDLLNDKLSLDCGIAVSKGEVESLKKTLAEIERDNEWYEDTHKVLKAELVTSQEANDELALSNEESQHKVIELTLQLSALQNENTAVKAKNNNLTSDLQAVKEEISATKESQRKLLEMTKADLDSNISITSQRLRQMKNL